MADIIEKIEDTTMEVGENPEASTEAPNENEQIASLKEDMKEENEVEQEGDEHADEIIEEDEMEESEEIDEKPAVEKTAETTHETDTANAFAISKIYQDVSAVDIGKCMIMVGLPSSLYDDSEEIFNDCVVSMLEEDFTVKKDSIASITRLNKGEDEENGCRVMVSFKSRVHKHRVMAVKNRSNVGYTLEQVESVPVEVADLLKENVKEEEKEIQDDKEGSKKEEMKKEEEKFKDEHSTLPFVIDWDGAPEFQWKIPEGKGGATLVIENADTLDLYEPFLYRASLKAQSVSVKMPGRVIDDQPTARHYGTISLQYLNDGEAIRYAMVNLIYFRSKGDRRIKVYLPQTTVALKRKSEFEKRLGRKIVYPEAMKKIMVKSTDVSLAECTFGVDEAKAVFPHKEIESVERITDSREKVGFVITFKCAHDTVMAHASTRNVKVGEITCRIYMIGSECNGSERVGREYLTRMEVIAQNKEDQAKKKKEYDEKVAKGEITPPVKKTFPKKPVGGVVPIRKPRGTVPLSTSKTIPINKSNGPSFKQPTPSARGARSTGYTPRTPNMSPRGPAPSSGSSSSSSRGRMPRPRREDERVGGRSRGPSPWMDNGRRNGGGIALSTSAFNKDDLRLEQMVREQRRQMEMQEALLRQQEMITVMADRLHQPALSSSAFRQRDHELSASSSAFNSRPAYGVPSAVAYNKASAYTPSPAYEPLTATMTPSHLSNPVPDNYRGSSYTPQYGKSPSSSYPSSSSYRDHRY